MSRSFGPVVVVDPSTNEVDRVHCHWCIFNDYRPTGRVCSHIHRSNPRKIEDPDETPDWCKMKAGNIQDTLDMVRGVSHSVVRWSGRRTDEPRVIYEGIPSEAERQFRIASGYAKRGTVVLEGANGETIATWPEGGDA